MPVSQSKRGRLAPVAAGALDAEARRLQSVGGDRALALRPRLRRGRATRPVRAPRRRSRSGTGCPSARSGRWRRRSGSRACRGTRGRRDRRAAAIRGGGASDGVARDRFLERRRSDGLGRRRGLRRPASAAATTSGAGRLDRDRRRGAGTTRRCLGLAGARVSTGAGGGGSSVIVASSGGDSSTRSGRRIGDCSSARCTASDANAATASDARGGSPVGRCEKCAARGHVGGSLPALARHCRFDGQGDGEFVALSRGCLQHGRVGNFAADAHASAVDDQPVGAEPAHRAGQQSMLDRQHARGERGLVVVLSCTGTAPCATIGPRSTSEVTKCTVQPWMRTPSASARRCVCEARIRGQQRRMDVEQPARVARDERRRRGCA